MAKSKVVWAGGRADPNSSSQIIIFTEPLAIPGICMLERWFLRTLSDDAGLNAVGLGFRTFEQEK